jgi:hypothetical protein
MRNRTGYVVENLLLYFIGNSTAINSASIHTKETETKIMDLDLLPLANNFDQKFRFNIGIFRKVQI